MFRSRAMFGSAHSFYLVFARGCSSLQGFPQCLLFLVIISTRHVYIISLIGHSNSITKQLHYQSHLDEWRAGPMGLASAPQAYLRTRRNPDGQINPQDMTVPPLPEGWKEEFDGATGVYYYVHDESGKRSWVRPNFRPPGPGGPMMGGGPGGPPMMGGTSLISHISSLS